MNYQTFGSFSEFLEENDMNFIEMKISESTEENDLSLILRISERRKLTPHDANSLKHKDRRTFYPLNTKTFQKTTCPFDRAQQGGFFEPLGVFDLKKKELIEKNRCRHPKRPRMS